MKANFLQLMEYLEKPSLQLVIEIIGGRDDKGSDKKNKNKSYT